MMMFDVLRPPGAFDARAAAYKDWLHLNLVDHRSGVSGLVNMSLHGPPDDPRSQVVGTALVHVPGIGWAGNVLSRAAGQARIGASSITLAEVAVAVHHASGVVEASARLPQDRLALRVRASAVAPAFAVEQPMPLGPGWISWYVVPRLRVEGSLSIGDTELDLSGASAYHDHNWGRWHWGQNLGWDWGTFLAPQPGPAVVVARTTDRAHRHVGELLVLVDHGGVRRTFRGEAVTLTTSGTLDAPPRRLPGALAALHADRAVPRLPATVSIEVDDGIDRLRLDFRAQAAAQLIAADPLQRGYAFIHESTGTFRCHGRLGGAELEAEGLGVVERVD